MKPTLNRAALAASFVLAISGAASADTFSITFTNLGPQPLSPLFWSASTDQFNIFSLNGKASAGIKHIAEMGDASTMTSIAAAAGSAVGSYGVLGTHPITTGQSSTGTFSADASDPYFSFASMLGKTNDGFIGESVNSMGLQLFQNGTAHGLTYIVYGTRAWDAGTEADTQNAADLAFLGGTGNPAPEPGQDFVHVNAGIIAGVGDSWQLQPNWAPSTALAEITITPAPEPSSVIPLALGVLSIGVGGMRKRLRSR